MNGGTISGNAASRGAGVRTNGTFTMNDGNISGNRASEYGGGVFVYSGTFTKIGGIISGYSSDQNNGNVVKDNAGSILARKGHAVYVNAERRKETTAYSEDNLSSNNVSGWDN